MKYYFPIHLDGGNRGCEAIAKGTAIMLEQDKENLIGCCSNVELDRKLGIDRYVTLEEAHRRTLAERILFRIYKQMVRDENKQKSYFYRKIYHRFISQMTKEDIMISTGGDMMCYDNNQVIYTNDLAKSKGIKTILWGCSVGKENLTPEKIATLLSFDLIYARESLTARLMGEIGCKNVCLAPDPAFILMPEKCALPVCFHDGKKVFGLNVSNFVVGSDNPHSSLFGKALIVAMDYLVKNTDYNILLIPHVLWKGQDDRLVSNTIRDEYSATNRVFVLNTDDYNYCQIRYVISKCWAFCGARTHSVISAYSTCVPTIALGYSVKSRGIARDLGLPDCTVVDSKHLKDTGDLKKAVEYVLSNRDQLKGHLTNRIPVYTEGLQSVKGWLNEVNSRTLVNT